MLEAQLDSMGNYIIEVHETLDHEIQSVVNLFCESGQNQYNWSIEKWRHYYRDYTDGKSVSLVAVVNETVVAHYGILPIRVNNHNAMLGMHAYVSHNYRGLAVISALMESVIEYCTDLKVAFLCGFANPQFSFIKSKLYKWNIVCWLGVNGNVTSDDLLQLHKKEYTFQYSPEWWNWRFGYLNNNYVSRYVDESGYVRKQLLKSRIDEASNEIFGVEGWSPKTTYATNQTGQRCQPFSVKVLNEKLISEGILDYRNWGIEMGDSDTFVYLPW
jgi:hypothetical protein